MYTIYEALLNERGLKNADIARATGISNMTLSDWKRGVSTPKQDKLMKIADCLGVSVDYLLTGEEPKVDLSAQADLWVAIRHDYDGYASLEGSGPYSKSRMDCDSDFCCPKRNSCPIYKDAPEKLR